MSVEIHCVILKYAHKSFLFGEKPEVWTEPARANHPQKKSFLENNIYIPRNKTEYYHIKQRCIDRNYEMKREFRL